MSHPLLEDLYGGITRDLAAVEEEMRGALETPRAPVAAMCRHLGRYGGKRLRPALVFLTARAAGAASPGAAHRRLAAVVELVHVATLVHDDVIDEAGMRRRSTTVNAEWSNHDAVLLGDIVFARAIHLLGRIGDPRSLLTLTAAVSTLCEGEIIQNRHRHDVALTEEAYYAIIEAKTGVLFAAGCELAAHLAGASDEVVAAFRRFGGELGLAFQIIDDCLDLVGSEREAGKTLGTDLRHGKMTLPLILLRDELRDAEADVLERAVSRKGQDAEDQALLQNLLRRHGTVDASVARAREHAGRALTAVRGAVPAERMPTLEAVADFVFRRRA